MDEERRWAPTSEDRERAVAVLNWENEDMGVRPVLDDGASLHKVLSARLEFERERLERSRVKRTEDWWLYTSLALLYPMGWAMYHDLAQSGNDDYCRFAMGLAGVYLLFCAGREWALDTQAGKDVGLIIMAVLVFCFASSRPLETGLPTIVAFTSIVGITVSLVRFLLARRKDERGW